MDIKFISTGKMVMEYLMENNYKITDLLESCNGVSSRSIYRFLNGEGRVSLPIAEGVHKLINEISVDFLLSYDAKYLYQKKQEEKEIGLDDKSLNSIITKYKLQKFYPELKGNKIELFEHAANILGKDNLLNDSLSIVSSPKPVYFSKAKKSDEAVSNLWVTVSFYEARKKYGENIRDFSSDGFANIMNHIKQLSKAVTKEQIISNIEYFSEESGINFLWRQSVPNSRVKGAIIKDENGRIYIIMSDLFKCIERFWLTFIHEVHHIKNGDLDKENRLVDEEEKKIDEDVISFLVESDMNESREYSTSEIRDISKRNNVAMGLVAEIARYKSGNYKDYGVNSLIHYF